MNRRCTQCEIEINPKRLQAVPSATLCVSCAEKSEQPCRETATNMLRLAYTRSQEDTYATRAKGSRLWSRRGLATYGLGAAC